MIVINHKMMIKIINISIKIFIIKEIKLNYIRILKKINNILPIGKIAQIHKNRMTIKAMMDKEELLNLI